MEESTTTAPQMKAEEDDVCKTENQPVAEDAATTTGGENSTGEPESTEPEKKVIPSAEELEANIRTFLTKDTAHKHTKRTIREHLSKNFGMSADALLQMKNELNDIVAKVVQDIAEETQEPRKRAAETTASGPRSKQAKAENDEETSEQAESEEDEDDAEESSSEEDEAPSRRRPKAKAKQGVKAAQSKLMTKASFLDTAKAFDCKIGDFEFKLDPRLFSTGSCGWYFGGKIPLPIGEGEATCTIGLNCTVVGSKTWSEGKKARK